MCGISNASFWISPTSRTLHMTDAKVTLRMALSWSEKKVKVKVEGHSGMMQKIIYHHSGRKQKNSVTTNVCLCEKLRLLWPLNASNCIYILERGDVKCCMCGRIKTVGENSCIIIIWLNRDIYHTTSLENLMKNLLD